MSLALGMMVLGLGVVLLGTMISLRDRRARRGEARTAAHVNADALMLGFGISAMVLGLGVVAIGVL